MPAKRELTMRQLRQMLRLAHDGLRAREIGRRLGVARSTVHAEPVAAIWGAGETSSSDGQFFRAGAGRRTKRHQRQIRRRSGNAPLHAHLGSVRAVPRQGLSATMDEAPHVLDGLLHHGSTLTIKETIPDTGGANDHVFALCHLLVIRFVPRLRDFQDYRLGVVEKARAYKGIESLFGRPIRIDVIREHWDEIIRLADFDQGRHSGAIGDLEEARRLPAPEPARPRAIRTGPARAHIVHARLAGEPGTTPAMSCRLNKGESAPCPRSGRLPAIARSVRRPHVQKPELSRVRPQPRHRGDRLLEHRLSLARRGISAQHRRRRSGRPLTTCRAARVEPHQPDGRLPLDRAGISGDGFRPLNLIDEAA